MIETMARVNPKVRISHPAFVAGRQHRIIAVIHAESAAGKEMTHNSTEARLTGTTRGARKTLSDPCRCEKDGHVRDKFTRGHGRVEADPTRESRPLEFEEMERENAVFRLEHDKLMHKGHGGGEENEKKYRSPFPRISRPLRRIRY